MLDAQTPDAKPVRLAIAGLVHGHVSGFLRAAKLRKDVEIVGVFDPDAALTASYAKSNGFAPEIRLSGSGRDAGPVKPEAVATFTSTGDHAMVVEACAARHIPVMMEKPLAVDMAQARAIQKAAAAGGIPVMVNYETTWYKSHGEIWKLIKEQKAAGEIRKMVAMDGHEGPKEINVQPEFLAWLTDPVKNGAGALFDFGCYGANLMTWLMDNQRPLAVTAMAQTNKPGDLREGGRRGHHPGAISQGAGHHSGVVELAVQPQGFRSLRREGLRHRDRRRRAARPPAGPARRRDAQARRPAGRRDATPSAT